MTIFICRYAHEKGTFGDLKVFPALSIALESKVIAERETLFTSLKELTRELVCCGLLFARLSLLLFCNTNNSQKLLVEWECSQAI